MRILKKWLCEAQCNSFLHQKIVCFYQLMPIIAFLPILYLQRDHENTDVCFKSQMILDSFCHSLCISYLICVILILIFFDISNIGHLHFLFVRL